MSRPARKANSAPTRTSCTVIARPCFPTWLTALLLALVTIALYWPATRFDFINFDDPLYVTDNSHVQAGLTWEGLAWAFGRVHGEGTYWHPLSWVSHMVDCQLYGLKPGGHHLTSVLLHAANAVLVFLVFRRMTGAFWRCALLAALFALHPLQVDSVAWVTERKNLLSAFFWLLTTWAYVRYAELHSLKSKLQRQGAEARSQKTQSGDTQDAASSSPFSIRHPPAPFFYVMSLVLLALGLMCKPVLVTLPFALLLLDYWPLQRFGISTFNSEPSTVGRLLREKIPFFGLAVASSAITIMAHQALGSLDAISKLPWDTRLENALVSYVRYFGKTFWPSRLAVFYPYPAAWPMWEVVTCGLVLLAVSGLVLRTGRNQPWLFVGWFWFLGVLVPFSGLVQAGAQAMADRFMYVPVVGIIVAMIWGLHGLAKGGRYQQMGWSVAGSAAIALCLVLTRQQLGHWKNSEALFRHALEVTEHNYLAHNNLGVALFNQGQTDEAIRQYQEAIRLLPSCADAHYNLGNAYGRKGQTDEALAQFQEAVRLKPDYALARNNLGAALFDKGHTDGAITQYQEALRLQPDYAEAHFNLGTALGKKGQIGEAIRQFWEAIRLKPDYAEAHFNLGIALGRKGQTDEAINQYQEALRLKPDDADAHYNLGIAFGRKGQLDGAISQFQEALRLKPDYADAHKYLNTALAARTNSSKQPGAH
jgi:protein O-mannosyl-transferase